MLVPVLVLGLVLGLVRLTASVVSVGGLLGERFGRTWNSNLFEAVMQ